VPQVEELRVWHVVAPLSRPYVLSFGVLHHFEAFIAVARFTDGALGFGESCPLPGYSHETAELLTAEYTRLARTGDVAEFLDQNRTNPFVTAPLLSCLEGPAPVGSTGRVELCPILQWDHIEEIPERIAALSTTGYCVAKVKLTADLAENHTVIRRLQPAGAHVGMRFRYDANQALTPDQAERVTGWLDHPTTELLEQPLGVDAWDAMARLHANCPVPLMLDEAIVDPDSVEQATGCADLIKLKLAKNGSPARLGRLIGRARELGLDVVLGNGVQTTLGCWLEAHVQSLNGLPRPGEMNGFRKLRHDPLAFLLVDRGPAVELPPVNLERIPDLLRQWGQQEFAIPVCSAGPRSAPKTPCRG
jgi:L-alanine-DL-glutamate epimerase-like enolase superfamily enzyme